MKKCILVFIALFASLTFGQNSVRDASITQVGNNLRLNWTPPAEYKRVSIWMDSALLKQIAPPATTYTILNAADKYRIIRIIAVDKNEIGWPMVLTFSPAPPATTNPVPLPNVETPNSSPANLVVFIQSMAPASVHVRVPELPEKAEEYSFDWDFGDTAAGRFNKTNGFNSAHTYDAPGEYTITLKSTSLRGEVKFFSQKIAILPDARKYFYVDPQAGNDGNAGTISAPLKSAARGISKLTDNTGLLFKSGSSLVIGTQQVRGKNIRIASYGEGAKPYLVNGDPTTIFSIDPSTRGLLIENLKMFAMNADTPNSNERESRGNIVNGRGEGITLRRNIVSRANSFFNGEAAPKYNLVVDNQTTDDNSISGYFFWPEGSFNVFLGNYVHNSTREHGFRSSADAAVWNLIQFNTIRNHTNTSLSYGDKTLKTCVNFRLGSIIYVGDNDLQSGTNSFGPTNAIWMQGVRSPVTTVRFERNKLSDGAYFETVGNVKNIFVINNRVTVPLNIADARESFSIVASRPEQKGAKPGMITLTGNIVTNDNSAISAGKFVKVYTDPNQPLPAPFLTLQGNEYIAPRLSLVDKPAVDMPDLKLLAWAGGNKWPARSTTIFQIGDRKLKLVDWNSLSLVGGRDSSGN